METKKIIRIDDEQCKMLEILKKKFKSTENTIFRMALEKLYKEFE